MSETYDLFFLDVLVLGLIPVDLFLGTDAGRTTTLGFDLFPLISQIKERKIAKIKVNINVNKTINRTLSSLLFLSVRISSL